MEQGQGGGEKGKLETMDHDSVDAACWGLYKLTHLMPAFAKAEWKGFLSGLQVSPKP